MADIIDGVNIRMGGQVFYVPPLNFKRVRQMRAKLALISQIASIPTDAEMTMIAEVTLSAIERNYPTMDLKQLDEMLDLGNIAPILKAIMGASGFEENKAGEAAARP